MTSPGRSPPTGTTTTTQHRASTHQLPPLALLVYPITLLVGSLYSTISPTARGFRADPSQHHHPAPLAPSLATDVNLASPPESPVNYFARKNNIFNLYFVKIGWLWLTAAFAILVVSQRVYRSPPSAPSSVHQAKQRRILQASARYATATVAWYLMTQWFFGAPVIDRGFLVTGGRCEKIASAAGDITSSTRVEMAVSAAACRTAGGTWTGGHDVSGHVFMLVLATAVLVVEVLGVVGVDNLWGAVACGGGADDSKKKDGEGEDVGEAGDAGLNSVQVWSVRFVLGVAGLGWWMLFMTAIWFHTWLEKVFLSLSLSLSVSWFTVADVSTVVWVGDCLGHRVYHLLPTAKGPCVEECRGDSWSLRYF